MFHTIELSVHRLVDFLLRKGDIDDRVYNKASMQEGTVLHRLYQSKQNEFYLSEYHLLEKFVVSDVTFVLEGKADGIINVSPLPYVDEIKTTVIDLDKYKEEQDEWHLGQAKCYALMYAHEKNIDEIGIKMTYIHQLTNEKKIYTYVFKTIELEQFVYELLDSYLLFYNIVLNNEIKRNESAKTLSFPFASFRKGQRELAKYCYSIAKNGGRLFVEAPTGIGKTMSTLFPFIKSFASTDNEKIFYLTAKGSGQDVASNAALILKEQGLFLTFVQITAKEKICFCKDKGCNPDECPFAKDYYNKIQSVLRKAILEESTFTNEEVSRIAKENEICPFELQLDLSLFCDLVICDYNYLFDPLVYLRRHFDACEDHYLVLIDEAHNLSDRGRAMYSASLSTYDFKAMKKSLKNLDHKKIKSAIRKLTKFFNEFIETYIEENTLIADFDPKFYRALENYFKAGRDVLKNFHRYASEEFLTFFFEVNKFLKISEFLDETYAQYVKRNGKNNVELNLYCLNPSDKLASQVQNMKGVVYFSATLSPIDYYVNVLGGREDDPCLLLNSPFPKENFLLMIAPKISIKYSRRKDTYDEVALYIKNVVNQKIGNYLIFVPSYEYLDNLIPYFDRLSDISIHIQTKEMSMQDVDDFLETFKYEPKQSNVGFVVIGGVFSEGIDLMDDRLYGAIVVGVGLPQISFEKDIIRDYYNKIGLNGFDYSYLNPAMNRVMQAVGRVIRSETDRGLALLIDERYMLDQYRLLFKSNWSNYEVIITDDDIIRLTNNFEKK